MSNILNKILFITFHTVFDPRYIFIYKKFQRNRNKPYPELVGQQEEKLKKLIKYAYQYVPYYKRTFDEHNIDPETIQTLKDLDKIPILTRGLVQDHFDEFKPEKRYRKFLDYFDNPTGGTTGTPLLFKISRMNKLMANCLLYRGWSNAGFELGDKVVFLSGSSLSMNTKNTLWLRIQEFFRNARKLSAFDLDDETMRKYVGIINKFRPRFLRGYPSAIYYFSKFIDDNKVDVWKPDAVFTTSEVLYPHMKEQIEKTFKCNVFNGYGLNDGGVSAHECKYRNGLHIDTERSILQVVDENGRQIENGTGRIIATDLHNFVFPFIRYDTGDVGELESAPCTCDINTPRIIRILGRSVDNLFTPEGKSINGWFFIYIFWKYQKGIEKYQVVQKDLENIEIKLVTNENFDEEQIEIIRRLVEEKSKEWKLRFKFVDQIKLPESGKQIFVINELAKK